MPRRTVVRMDHDSPWIVSVAETPHDVQSYSLYIKTPTHNLTLTRTAKEIIELDRRLSEAHSEVSIPALPVELKFGPSPPPKRKSNFLNTLSRLASPSSAKTYRNTSSGRLFNNASPPTSLASPSSEIGDPFVAVLDATPVTPSATSTALAAYFTTISNSPGLREGRLWKRFVRVRTDDLESVRVERAIKTVRSDLAAHLVSHSRDNSAKESTFPEDTDTDTYMDRKAGGAMLDGDNIREGREDASIKEDLKASNGDVNEAPSADVKDESAGEVTKVSTSEAASMETEQESDLPTTPTASETVVSRIQRSHSVDFDSTRTARQFGASASSPHGVSSQTGDESSASTTGVNRHVSKRKKRSKSMAPKEPRKSLRKVVIDDFEMMRVLGKGCAGKVLLVRHKATSEMYALKAITKRHVLAHQELQHTLTEQAVLKRMAAESRDPFVVKLWWSFHDKENLFLVMDFHPGGDLATQLARWGRLGRDRARFYAAEIVEGCEGLHAAGVIYRDLKPENILIGADGHIVLTDFGLSKEFARKPATHTAPSTPTGDRNGDFYSSVSGSLQPTVPPWMVPDANGELALGWPGQIGTRDSTSTFCGTAEYLAPEVIQGSPYSYEVDWWSFGTMLYEMLTGITPFWADNHADMYVRVLQDELQFPEDRAMDQDTKSLIRGLLQRNPALRICEPRIKKHPYFSMIDWSHVYYKRYIPPYIPPIDPSNASDTQNFDDTFLDMEPVLDDPNDEQMETDQEPDQTDTDRTDGEETNTTPSQSRSSSIRPAQKAAVPDDTVDVFDGYSFKGRHSVVLDEDDDDDGSEGGSFEEEEEEVGEVSKNATVDSTGNTRETDTDSEVPEPKTPEARPTNHLPRESAVDEGTIAPQETTIPASPTEKPAPAPLPKEETLRKSKDLPELSPIEVSPPAIPEKDLRSKTTAPPRGHIPRAVTNRTRVNRKEKSGVAALDRYISDDADTDMGVTGREDDDEDDDWDLVEAGDGEDKNGTKGTSLFARGVVDRYRLAVFRKASTPVGPPRTFSGVSKASQTPDHNDSPTFSQKRGRTHRLAFHKSPKQILGKVPPSSFSSRASTAKSFASGSNTISATSSRAMLTSPSQTRSLKSKESAMSVSGQSQSSDQSGNGELGIVEAASDSLKQVTAIEELEKPNKTKKLKKYKENAEKVFSLFSPR